MSRKKVSVQPQRNPTILHTMQAAIHEPNTPVLKIVDNFEIPKPGKKEVLLKIQASGVCHSDVWLHPII